MKSSRLSEIFNLKSKNLNDEDLRTGYGYNYHWFRTPNDFEPKQKIFYSIGCSWLKSNFWSRVVNYHLPKHFHINRSVGGQSNFEIIETLRSDIEYVTKLDSDVVFVVSLTEPVRCQWELKYLQPNHQKTATEYLKDLFENEYQQIIKILNNHRHYITTSFVPNYLNDNPTVMSYCKPTTEQPADCFHVQSGLYQWFRDRNTLFKFDINNDLDKVIDWREFMQNHQHMADHYHPNHYSVYENFLEDIEKTVGLGD